MFLLFNIDLTPKISGGRLARRPLQQLVRLNMPSKGSILSVTA